MSLTPIHWGTQLALVAGIAWLTAGPSAQGLGDIAKQEAARRQKVNAGKKYTNDDLVAVVESTPAPQAAQPAESATAPDEKDEKGEKDVAATPASGSPAITPPREKRDEKYWRERSGTIRAKLNETQDKVKFLQKHLAQVEALGQGGGPSATEERAITLKALTAAQADYRSFQEEWKRMEDRANNSKVPPEWLK
jgi:hypothetical protein